MNPTDGEDNPGKLRNVIPAFDPNCNEEAAVKRLGTIVTAVVIATVGWLCAACSGRPSPPGPAPAPASVVPAGTVSPTRIPSAFEIACTHEVLLESLRTRFDDPTTGLAIERADIRRCRNGYAHVYAVTKPDASGSSRFENEQLFLRFVDGEWQSVAEGTGISCDDEEKTPEHIAACLALGYQS